MALSSALSVIAPQHDFNGRLFLVNRDNALSENYVPELSAAKVKGQVRNMVPEAADALKEMFDACKKQTGVTLVSVSGYRSYGTQKNIYNRKLKNTKGNVDKANEYVAPPGASEHQTGLAMDVGQQGKTNLSAGFANTKGGQWLRDHCHEYGFIIRYDEGWENVTGYKYEPWHVRYVGKENAALIHDAGVPFETWLAKYRADTLLNLLSAGSDSSDTESSFDVSTNSDSDTRSDSEETSASDNAENSEIPSTSDSSGSVEKQEISDKYPGENK